MVCNPHHLLRLLPHSFPQFHYRHPLSGEKSKEPIDFYPVVVMIDNAYNIRPQHGLEQADIIYEAFAEGNITRLMAIFDNNKNIEKIGDWWPEYGRWEETMVKWRQRYYPTGYSGQPGV